MSDFWASFSDPALASQVAAGFVLYVIIVFFRQLDRILGPGVLLSYLLGRYSTVQVKFTSTLETRSSSPGGRNGDLFDRLDLPDEWTAEAMGSVTLRGKSEPTELVAFA